MNWVKKVSSDYDSYNSFAKDISFSFYIGDNVNYGNVDTISDDDGDDDGDADQWRWWWRCTTRCVSVPSTLDILSDLKCSHCHRRIHWLTSTSVSLPIIISTRVTLVSLADYYLGTISLQLLHLQDVCNIEKIKH